MIDRLRFGMTLALLHIAGWLDPTAEEEPKDDTVRDVEVLFVRSDPQYEARVAEIAKWN